MRTTLALSLATVAAPTLAQTVCPTAADVAKTGVLITFEDEVSEVHQEISAGQIQIDYMSPDYQGQSLYAHSVYALSFATIEDGHIVPGSVWVFSYVAGNDTLPIPEPGGSWESQSAYRIDGSIETEIVQHTWGESTSIQIGDCTYDAVPVRIDFDGDFYDHTEEMLFMPDLGTAILLAYEDGDGRDEYSAVSIGLP